MSDRKRFTGPEGSVAPIILNKPEVRVIDAATMTRGADGRFPEQMRAVTLRLDANSNSKGSCYLELGHTKLFCAIYGPRATTSRQGNPKAFQELGQLNCEIDLLPFSTEKRRPYPREPLETDLAKQLEEALLSVVKRDTFPNSVIDIYVNVIEADGSLLAAAITAASASFVRAGVEVMDVAVACEVASVPVSPDNQDNRVLLIDPTTQENVDGMAPHMTLTYMPNLREVAHISLSGAAVDFNVHEAMSFAMDGCLALHEQIKESFLIE